jgi:hypothetical protein
MLADGIGAAAKEGRPAGSSGIKLHDLPVCAEGQRSTRAGSAPTISTPGEMTQHDPWRATALAWRSGGDDNGLLGALQPIDVLFELIPILSKSDSLGIPKSAAK